MAGSYIVSASLIAATSHSPKVIFALKIQNNQNIIPRNFVFRDLPENLETANLELVPNTIFIINYFYWSLLVFLSLKQTWLGPQELAYFTWRLYSLSRHNYQPTRTPTSQR